MSGLRRALALAMLLVGVFVSTAAHAHDVRGELLFLDVGEHVVRIELQIPIDQLARARGEAPAAGESLKSHLRQHLAAEGRDGRAFDVEVRDAEIETVGDGQVIVAHAELRAPEGDSVRWFSLRDDIVLFRLTTHDVHVFLRSDLRSGVLGEGDPEWLGSMHYQEPAVVVDLTGGSVFRGFKAVFALGMRHIAEGWDHLAFLLMLLLALPRTARGGRWSGVKTRPECLRNVVQTVTAFTVGHSLTLAAAALHGPILPSSVVEGAVVVSVLVSAAHAVRPLFPGREAWVAAGFGLLHGLAFSSALRGFGFEGITLSMALAGFNAGIEAMQIVVVVVALPLMMMMRKHASKIESVTRSMQCAIRWR